VVVLAFAILFASNFTVFVHVKGDDFFYTLYFMVAATYIFYFTLYFTIFKKGIVFSLLLLFLPLVISIFSFFLGIVVMLLFFRGTPVQDIYIYSITYSYLAVGALVYWLYLKGEILG
jgi:hypothetical protein